MRKSLLLFLLAATFLFIGCGDTNFFEWSHTEGSNKSVQALTSDAEAALHDGNYAKATEYYEEIIQKEPTNSVAQYGIAQAAYGESGISLATLVSSFLEDAEDDSNPAPALMYNNLDLVSRTSGVDSDLIPFDLDDMKALYEANETVIPALTKIAEGECDGVIPADDPDVNINLAISLVLQAALRILDSNQDGDPAGTDDLISVNKDYTIQVNEDIATYSDIHKLYDQLRLAIVYVIGGTKAATTLGSDFNDYIGENGAIQYLDKAMGSDQLGKTGILEDLEDDFDKLFEYEQKASDEYDLAKLWDEVKAAAGV